jgi:hypothetical protein
MFHKWRGGDHEDLASSPRDRVGSPVVLVLAHRLSAPQRTSHQLIQGMLVVENVVHLVRRAFIEDRMRFGDNEV